jgi:hypothetical protein
MKTLRGSTRLTILCGKWAIKIPYSKSEFYGYIHGILSGWKSNRNEFVWSKCNKETQMYSFLCPVRCSFLFSMIIVMDKATPISCSDFKNIDKQSFDFGGYEHKQDSFGKINGEVVIVDYGE